MNLFQLVAKQMRQRALSTWLTMLSVLLGVALATALLVFQREGGKLFGQSEFGYDLIVGAKGSKLQLVLNSVYQLDQAPGTVNWGLYEALNDPRQYGPNVDWAVPIAAADYYEGHPVLATLPSILGYENDGETRLPEGQRFEYRVGQELELARGTAFHARKFEAVLGSETAKETGLDLGDTFQVTHGRPDEAGAHEHTEEWTVVGILEPTGTSLDDVVLLPIVSSLAVDAHGSTLESIGELLAQGQDIEEFQVDLSDVIAAGGIEEEYYVLEPETGIIHLKIPQELWRVSGIFVNTTSGFRREQLSWEINNRPEAMAASPAQEMRVFFERFLQGPSQLLLLVTLLVTVVAAVSILVSIYNSVSARRREIAILRSLGATRTRVLALICLEAGLIGLLGGLIGWLLGHALSAAGSEMLRERLGEGIDWMSVGGWEIVYLAGVVLLAVLAGLVPALKAYSTPVAANLSE